MQPQFNDEVAVPVGVPGALVVLPLALPALQLELSLYAGHATRNRPELADPKVREPVRTPTRQVWPFSAASQQYLLPFSRDSASLLMM